MLFFIEHALQDAESTRLVNAERSQSRCCMWSSTLRARLITFTTHPTLTTVPSARRPTVEEILSRPECGWLQRDLEQQALDYAIERSSRNTWQRCAIASSTLDKTEAAVKERLTKEISYWDHRAEDLKLQEQAAKSHSRLNSGEARKRADKLQARLARRLDEIKRERQISPLPPNILGGVRHSGRAYRENSRRFAASGREGDGRSACRRRARQRDCDANGTRARL